MGMKVYYYQYKNLKLVLLFRESNARAIDAQKLAEELKTHPGRQSLFNASLEQFDTESMTLDERLKRQYQFEINMRLEDFHLCGQPVEEVEFSGEAQLQEINKRLPIVMSYGAPQEDPAQRNTMLQKMPDSETGFVLHASERYTAPVGWSRNSVLA